MSIGFHFQKVVLLKAKRRLVKFITHLVKKEGYTVESIDFVFCSDRYLLKINRDFLNHDYFTDIITFDMSDINSPGISGEIYISVDTVKSNAKEFDVDDSEELNRVMFHGVLHLCGYKDKSPRDKKLMRKREDYYLKMFHGEH